MFDISQPITVDGDRDEERYQALFDVLMPQFAESPEARACAAGGGGCGHWAAMFLDYYFNYLGDTVSKITPRDVREVVFELIPRKVAVESDAAAEIVLELRAFWEFLGREYRLPQAAAIVTLLSDEAIVRLKGLLADPRNFGMAKSFVMKGHAAGFDMTTEQGTAEFMAAYNAEIHARRAGASAESVAGLGPLRDIGVSPLADCGSLVTPPGRDDRKATRKKRKAERQARKRNRR